MVDKMRHLRPVASLRLAVISIVLLSTWSFGVLVRQFGFIDAKHTCTNEDISWWCWFCVVPHMRARSNCTWNLLTKEGFFQWQKRMIVLPDTVLAQTNLPTNRFPPNIF